MREKIFIIIIIAFLLRVIGLGYGLPMQLVGDETSLIGGSLKMLEAKTLIPALAPEQFRLLYYPPVMSYVYLAAFLPYLSYKFLTSGGSIEAIRSTVALDPSVLWLIARLVTVLLGTLLVYLVFNIGRRLFGSGAGLAASALVATSFLAVQQSHFARHWMPATFFAYLVIALGFFIYLRPERRAYLLAGALGGIAFGVSYITAVAMAVPIATHFIAYGKKALGRPQIIWLALMICLFAIIATIGGLLNFPELKRIVVGEDTGLVAAKSFSRLLQALIGSVSSFFHYDPVVLLAGLAGIIVLALQHPKLAAVFGGFPLFYWLVLYFFFHFEPRYNMLLVPWFCLLGGYAWSRILTLPLSRTISLSMLIIGLLVPFSIVAYYDWLLLKPDTRQLAVSYIEDQIPPGSKIGMYLREFGLIADQASVNLRQREYPYTLRTKDTVLQTLSPDQYPSPAFYTINIQQLTPEDREKVLRDVPFEYIITEQFEGEELPGILSSIPLGKNIAEFSSGPVAMDVNANLSTPLWEIFTLHRLGPQVVIYQQ